MSCENHKKGISRREFIGNSTASLTGVLIPSSVISLIASGCGGSSAKSTSAGGDTTGPSPTSIGNNQFSFDFTTFPALQTVGGAVTATAAASSGSKNVAVVRFSSSTVFAVSTTCTHQGCSIGSYSSSTQNFTCPCHGSVFSASGSVSTGPATSALTSYTAIFSGSGITVTIP